MTVGRCAVYAGLARESSEFLEALHAAKRLRLESMVTDSRFIGLAKALHVHFEEFVERLLFRARHGEEADGRTKDVFGPLLTALHLNDGTEDLTGNVDPAITREDHRHSRAGLNR